MTDATPAIVLGVSLKLYLDIAQSVSWATQVAALTRDHVATSSGRLRIFVLPSLPAVPAVRETLRGSPVEVGAQDLFWEDRGPFTGAVSGTDLRDWGCTLVEVGHAERRQSFGEDDGTVRRKVAAALRNDLTAVLCVGEQDDVPADVAAATVRDQLRSAMDGAPTTSRAGSLVLAYEPEWAIGAKQAAHPTHIRHVTAALRSALGDYPWLVQPRVIYGGSARPGLLPALHGSVDGLFLGRFAHDPEAFGQIIAEAAALA